MLTFKKIKVKNFKSFKEAELILDNQGLVLIEGENLTNDQYETNASGKCLRGDSVLYNGETGEQVTVEEFIHNKIPTTYGMNKDMKLEIVPVKDWITIGKKPMIEVATTSGKKIVCAPTHPIYTDQGWVKAGDLTKEHYIAEIRRLPDPKPDNTHDYSYDFMFAIGALIGDGYLNHKKIMFTNSDKTLFKVIEKGLQEEFPETFFSDSIYSKGKGYCRALRKMRDVANFLESIGVLSTSRNKVLKQEFISQLNTNQIQGLLSGLYTTDGEIQTVNVKTIRRTISITTASKGLRDNIQQLLFRLGILSTTTMKKAKNYPDNKYYRVHTLAHQWSLFHDNVRFVGEKGEMVKTVNSIIKDKFKGKNPQNNYDVIPPVFNKELPTTPLKEYGTLKQTHRTRKQLDRHAFSRDTYKYWVPEDDIVANSDIAWFKVKTITEEETVMAYDIEVDTTEHSYIANDMVVHNSSALESITYAIYGTTGESLKADEVVNRDTGKNLSVKLYFEKDGKKYRIERYRKHHKHKNKVLFFQGNDELTLSTNKLTDELIQETIGLQEETYFNSIMYGQGDNEVFSQATDKGKKEILENITNIAVYAKAQDVAKTKRKETEDLRTQYDNKETQLINELSNIKDQVKQNEENYKYIKKQIKTIEEKLLKAEQELDSFEQQQENDDKIAQRDKLVKELDNLRVDTKDPVVGTEEAAQQAKDNINKLDDRLQAIQVKVQTNKNQIAAFNQEKANLDTREVCEYCGSPLSPEHAKEREQQINQQINNLQAENDTLNDMLNTKVAPYIKQFKEVVDMHEQKLQDVKKERVKHREQLQDKIYNLNDLIAKDNHTHEMLISSKKQLQEQLNEFKNIPKPDLKENKIEELEAMIKSTQEKIDEVDTKLNQYQDVIDAFSNKGIRSVVLDLVTPTLNESANKYLGELSDSFLQVRFKTQVEKQDGTLTDKFDVEVINGEDTVTYQSLSQGERTRVNVAISLALQDLVYQNAHLRANIGLYDEVFDGLDEKGVESVVAILNKRAKEVGTIYVITHSNTMKPLFENVLTIRKENNESKIIEES